MAYTGGIEILCSYRIFGRKERKSYVRAQIKKSNLESSLPDFGSSSSSSLYFLVRDYKKYMESNGHGIQTRLQQNI